MRLLNRTLMPRWSARLSRRRWITSPCRAPSGRRTGLSRMTRRLRGIRSFRSKKNQQGRPAVSAGLFLFFLGFFCVVNRRVFGEKRVFARGVLRVADGRMCGKCGLRDALFSGCAGSIWMPGLERSPLPVEGVCRARKCLALCANVPHLKIEYGAPGSTILTESLDG
jgi:hypothetical protein